VGTIVGDVTNDGVVGPGYDGGVLDIVGLYNQSDGATLEIEIGGTGPEDFDALEITGSVILRAGSLSGLFDNASSQVLFAGGRFDVSYANSVVTLSNFAAIPEPGGAAAGLAGNAAALSGRVRRRGITRFSRRGR
jgi:hypothetical protein